LRARPSRADIPYVYFLLSTYFFWLAIAESMGRAGMIMIENAEIVKKVSFPNVVLPVAITLSAYLHSLVGVMLFVLIFVFTGLAHLQLFFVVPVFLLQVLFSVGLALLLSAIIPYMRDLQQVMGYVIQGMFFLSPVLYSLDSIPEKFRNLAYLNPATVYIESYHRIIFDRAFPGIWQILMMCGISSVFLIGGAAVFGKLSEGFADIL
jgi:ABC-type polysaccharide/polyol phosphate export permease